MRVLLDTHTFLWWALEPEQLSPTVLALCQNIETVLLLSVVSLWEIQIKVSLGKLSLPVSLTALIESQKQANRVQILPVTLEHILALEPLPQHHKDPFDRLLIAQANAEQATLASVDPILARYPVSVIW